LRSFDTVIPIAGHAAQAIECAYKPWQARSSRAALGAPGGIVLAQCVDGYPSPIGGQLRTLPSTFAMLAEAQDRPWRDTTRYGWHKCVEADVVGS
jgi:hypothetical protein